MINKDIQLSEKNKFVLRMILVSEIEFYQAAIHTEIRKTGRKALRVGGVVKQLPSLEVPLAQLSEQATSEADRQKRKTPREQQQAASLQSFSQDRLSDAPKEQRNIWILKPADQSRGKGIFLFDRLDDLVYLSKSVVQRYITNPLLIFGYKFDLRLYAVVPSYAPFIVYIHSDGLVRFATEKFNLDDLKNVYAHLTNSSINTKGPQYLMNKGGIGRGCKWTIRQFRHWMHEQEMDDRLLWIRIQMLIVLTLLSQASSIPKIPNAYELFGFDILIDSQLRPWLIEVNANPSLSCDCIIDEMVKKPLLTAVLKMLELNNSMEEYGAHDERHLDNGILSAIRIEPQTVQQKHLAHPFLRESRPTRISRNTCPLYGRGSERLVPMLTELKHRFPELIQTVRCSSQSIARSKPLSQPHQKIKICNKMVQHEQVKDNYFTPITIPRPLDDDPTGIHLIPLRFTDLKLAFPFNLITRIACAKEKDAYPDVKHIVRAANRLVSHVTRMVKLDHPTVDESIIDIPSVWDKIS
ncbi:putative tubulin polyglutamylase TTLL2 [Fasciolopsis buskii]|uniref:Putative tubulin polyglutamylase TTLL2 n=1 Tax=Fasciolopsis buskii TaxID=27845 RepID=A0A8E0RLA3_9TREM|nr:putative tubulin polyglutamylase TTLL2 [Fasciolopsis buski]